MDNVLVITTKPDLHIDMLEKHLPRFTFTVLDPKEFPNIPLSFLTDQNESSVFIKGVNMTEIKVVWYRKPYFLQEEEIPVAKELRKPIHENYAAFIKWAYALFPNALWISDPWKILKGNSKIYQMQLAQVLGFRLPATLLTSERKRAESFISSLDEVVVKPLIPPAILEDETFKTMYTTVLKKEDLNLDGLNLSPMIFQEKIDGIDIRVTVVDKEVFVCKIIKIGDIAKEVDWRKYQIGKNLSYEEDKDFPKSLRDKCVKMVKEMGLVYGAFDFIKTGEDYFFLEINPNGQWGFVEEKCNLEISRAFAKLMSTALKK